MPDRGLPTGWYPVARSADVGTTPLPVGAGGEHYVAVPLRRGGELRVRLLGRTWVLRRDADGVAAEPPAWGVRERLGLIWLAPDEPADVDLAVPEDENRAFVAGWLPPERSAGPAGPLADNFLD